MNVSIDLNMAHKPDKQVADFGIHIAVCYFSLTELLQGKFFKLNQQVENLMAEATARHILVATEAQCLQLKSEIEAGADFGEIAKLHSDCPSGANGGDLGSFGPGMMVPEFDQVVFSADLNTVEGPVKTQFGYHLLEVTSRTD